MVLRGKGKVWGATHACLIVSPLPKHLYFDQAKVVKTAQQRCGHHHSIPRPFFQSEPLLNDPSMSSSASSVAVAAASVKDA